MWRASPSNGIQTTPLPSPLMKSLSGANVMRSNTPISNPPSIKSPSLPCVPFPAPTYPAVSQYRKPSPCMPVRKPLSTPCLASASMLLRAPSTLQHLTQLFPPQFDIPEAVWMQQVFSIRRKPALVPLPSNTSLPPTAAVARIQPRKTSPYGPCLLQISPLQTPHVPPNPSVSPPNL